MIQVRGGGLAGKIKITNYVKARMVLQDTAEYLAATFATNVAKELQKNIFYTVYKRRKSMYYDRTMEFLNSVKVSKNGKYYQVQFDYKNIEPEIRRTHIPGEKPTFNAHADTWGENEGTPFQKQLVEVLNDGLDKGRVKTDPTHFLEMTEAWIRANIDDAMMNSGQYKLLNQYLTDEDVVPFKSEFMHTAGFKIRKK